MAEHEEEAPDGNATDGNATDGNLTNGNETLDPGAPHLDDGGWLEGLIQSVRDFLPLGEAAHIVRDLLLIAVFIAVGYGVGRILQGVYRRVHRSRPTSGHILIGKLMVVSLVAVTAALGISAVYAVNPFGMVAALGIVSLALGFGLQNTVANLAGGVNLTVDKPFDVGDRVKVGETWGDVVTIGLRSIRILTVSGVHVVIPNSVLDRQEVWNYTHHHERRIRLELPIGISYDSSVPLAEALALRAARANEHVLAYPEPCVRVMGFGDSSVNLELRIWIDKAQDRASVRDKVLRQVKRLYDEEGVHFPFPQRTVGYLKDLEPAATTPEFLMGEAAERPVVMVCTRGQAGAQTLGDRVVEFAGRLGARLLVLHVRPPHRAMETRDGQAAINIYMAKAQRAGVPVKGLLEVGDFPKVLARVAREEGVRLVVFGDSRRLRVGIGWMRSELHNAMAKCPVPSVVLDTDRPLDAAFVEKWRSRIRPAPLAEDDQDLGGGRHGLPPGEGAGDAEPSAGGPSGDPEADADSGPGDEGEARREG